MSERAQLKRAIGAVSELPAPAHATSCFVEVGNLKLHYLDYGGAGPTLLCVHGGAAHAHWYDFVASGFTDSYRVISLDLRGHGDSAWSDRSSYSYAEYAFDIGRVAEALDLRRFVLMGHSMGGLVSLVYAASGPERLAKLIVVDSRMHMSKESIGRLRDMGRRPARSYASREELISRYRLEPAGTMIASPEVVRHVACHSGREFPDGSWRHKFDRSLYAIFERLDAMPCWDRVAIPALLVKGEHSKRIDEGVLAQIRLRSPRVDLVEVPESDHHVMLDNAPGFVERVRNWLDPQR